MKTKIGVAIATIVIALGATACSSSTPSTTPTTSGSSGSSSSGTPLQQFGSAHASDVQQFLTDIQTFGSDATAGNVTATGNDCASLVTDTKTLQSDGPVNNPSDEAAWSSALSDIQNGAQACVSAVQNNDTTLLQTAATDFQSGESAIQELGGVTGA